MNAIVTKRVLLSGPDDYSEGDVMQFRLIYKGPLPATQGEPRGDQNNPLAQRKQSIRKAFHGQLKKLWSTEPFLKNALINLDGGTGLPRRGQQLPGLGPMTDVLADLYQEFGYRFVPLVREEFQVSCGLDILFLRRDPPGSVITAGDLDNRLKTLIDALRKPINKNELRGNETPADGEDPFYCLLEDDKLISKLAVETDRLLDGEEDSDDRSLAHVVITVTIRPYFTTAFNLSFGA